MSETGASRNLPAALNDFDEPSHLVEVKVERRFTSISAMGQVTLVGSVPNHIFRAEPYPLGGAMPTHLALRAKQPTQASDDLVWEGLDAWWLSHLAPEIKPDRLAVVAKGEGDNLRLAVIGKLLASRPL